MAGMTTPKFAALLIGVSVFLLGCHGFGSKKTAAPTSPIGEVSSLSSSPALDHRYDERDLCIEMARTVAEKGYAEEAVKLYEKAEGLDPGEDPLDLQLAPLYAQVDQVQKAIERYRRVIADGEATTEVYNNLAWTLMEAGRYSESIEAIEQGLAIEPENQRLRATLAMTLYRSGDRNRSFEVFESAVGPSAAHHNLAILDLDAGHVESAVKHANLAAELPNCKQATIELRDSLRTELASAKPTSLAR